MATKDVIGLDIYPASLSAYNARQGKYSVPAFTQSSSDYGSYANNGNACAIVANLGSEEGKLLFVIGNGTINSCNAATYGSTHTSQYRKILSSLGIPVSDYIQNTNINTNVAFGIKYIDDVNNAGKKIFYVDWSEQYVATQGSWTFVSLFDYSQNSIYPVFSGQSITIEESSGSTETPSDDPYINVEKAIYTAAAVPICICFFFVIYKMFMRLRG